MNAGFKVYVLTALREHESYTSSDDVVGVYKSKESAEKAMNDALDREIAQWKKNMSMDVEEFEIKRESEMCSVYDTIGGIEYTEFSIFVKIVQG